MNIIDIDLSTPTIIFEFETGITGPAGKQGPQGVQGVQGPQGEKGNDGLGVPPGGVKGAVLTKISSNDNDTIWEVLDRVKISSTKPTLNEKLWVKTIENLFDKNNANILKAYIVGSDTVITNNENGRTLYIECEPNTTYRIRKIASRLNVGYTTDVPRGAGTIYNVQDGVSDVTTEKIYTTGADAKYLVVFYHTAVITEPTEQEVLDSIKIEKFPAKSPAIYVVNDKGEYEELINAEDTGWILATLTDKFATYSSGFEPMYRKQGKLVQIQGTIKPTAILSNGGNETTMFNLPVGFRPNRWQYFVCPGSGSNRWLLGVGHTGTVTISRYGTTGFIDIPAGAWLPFNVSFMID